MSAGRGQGRRRSWAGPLLIVLSGCASIGPATVSRDRVGYSAAVGESWKEQTLLNVVRLQLLCLTGIPNDSIVRIPL